MKTGGRVNVNLPLKLVVKIDFLKRQPKESRRKVIERLVSFWEKDKQNVKTIKLKDRHEVIKNHAKIILQTVENIYED